MRSRRPASLLAAALLAGACGGDDSPSPEAQVRAKLTQFSRATAAKDYRVLCEEVYASALTARVEAVGLPCETALRQALAAVQEPQLSVGGVSVRGDTAEAQVRTSARDQAPSRDTVRLRREAAGWRIVELAGQSGSPSPTPTAGDER